MHICKYLKQRVRRIGEKNGKSVKIVSKKKKERKKKTHEEVESHNSIQDWVFITVLFCTLLCLKA